jgi:glucosamine 6-phosphate synthetase-like amidotransferase/phosphosugar isomerase protein
MCGIVAVVGTEPAAPLLLDGLRRLEYRGYDSTGIATLVNGHFERLRAEGKLINLAEVPAPHWLLPAAPAGPGLGVRRSEFAGDFVCVG